MKKEIIYAYDLSSLDNVSKVRFVYVLKGRKGQKGLVKELNGRFIVPGCFIVPSSASEDIEEVFKFWNVRFEKFEVCTDLEKEHIEYVH